jgi:hypothetical protein
MTLIAFLLALPILDPSRTFPAYEYRIEAFRDEDLVRRLNQIGAGGWEIVSARRAVDSGTASYEVILKRPR